MASLGTSEPVPPGVCPSCPGAADFGRRWLGSLSSQRHADNDEGDAEELGREVKPHVRHGPAECCDVAEYEQGHPKGDEYPFEGGPWRALSA